MTKRPTTLDQADGVFDSISQPPVDPELSAQDAAASGGAAQGIEAQGVTAQSVAAQDVSTTDDEAAPTAPTNAPAVQTSAPSGGLKIVTIAPGTVSIPDIPTDELPPQRASDPYIGCTIDGRYKVEAVLGEGGMGVVYRCRHKIIDKKVAVKILRADLAREPEATERFLIEAKSASSIGNPHIIDISDFGQLPDGSTYFVMEYLEGKPLSELIDANGGGQKLALPRIVHIARQLAEGLAAAHEADIVHRDLKPDNIFLIDRGKEKDFVKILDFGIAKVSTAEQGITRAGSVFGTPHYMSPEQAAGAPVDHRVDVYSLGVILYELASGRVPFDADNFMGILTQHMYKAPTPIRALVPQPNEVPPGLEAIVLKCLSKRAEQRYQSMNDLLEDLNRLDTGNIPTAVPEMMQRSGGFNVPADYFRSSMPQPIPADPGGRRRSWPLYAGVAGVIAAVVIVGTIFAVSNSSSATPQAQPTAEAERPTPEPSVTPIPTPEVARVVLAVAPLDARVFLGDKDLGSSPVSVEVPAGEEVVVTIRAEGYADQELTLDGSESRQSIQLERVAEAQAPDPKPAAAPKPAAGPRPAAGPKPAAAPKPTPKPTGGGELVDPWGR